MCARAAPVRVDGARSGERLRVRSRARARMMDAGAIRRTSGCAEWLRSAARPGFGRNNILEPSACSRTPRGCQRAGARGACECARRLLDHLEEAGEHRVLGVLGDRRVPAAACKVAL